jgi:endogenous inhibitor of DNA gyrase (YacG/DUF329 family)
MNHKPVNLNKLKQAPLCPSCRKTIEKIKTVALLPAPLEQADDKVLHATAACCPHCLIALTWSLEVAFRPQKSPAKPKIVTLHR